MPEVTSVFDLNKLKLLVANTYEARELPKNIDDIDEADD